jgi:6-pyruvoyl-tetrahydropterin synthase
MSSDPWFDWLLDFGSLSGFSPIPPEFAAIDELAGANVNGWQDEEGNVRPTLDPLPPLPPNAPECAHAFYQSLYEALGGAWLYARSYCSSCQLRLLLNPFSGWYRPLTYIGFLIACGDNNGANWGDPCASGGVGIPQDCDYLRDWFSGYFTENCSADRTLTTDFSPAVHRLISEIISPTGRAFLWRLAYDQPVFWPLTFNPEILIENNRCKSFALAILLQIEALQELINQVSTETCFIQFEKYFDGILEGRRYTITDQNGILIGNGLIGYSKTLEFGFCLREKIFREDIGRVACEDDEDDMACDCEQIRQIVREEIERIEDNYLNPIKVVTDWLDSLFKPIENSIRAFFEGGDTSWARFLDRYNLLSAYIRPSNTTDEEVIVPTLTDRIQDGFDRSRHRQRIIYSCVNGVIRANVRVSVTGNRITSSDTWIQPDAIRPYNHYGQIWLVYQVGLQPLRRTAWQWIRSRDHELVFSFPDLRTNSADTITVSAEYQLFAGLQMEAGYPLVNVLIPELGAADLWIE